ncbi:MAG: cache domain-containing protein, partial [Deltaproteobacteria bacterium]|nr:cache domain-containing protein [Deltaproteobacteria bacterium]
MGISEKKISISRLLFGVMATLAVLTILAVGYMVIALGTHLFKVEAERLRENYVREQKQVLKSEVEKVFDFINFQYLKTENRLKNLIQTRTYEAHAIAINLYRENYGKMSKAELEKNILDALRPIRFNNGRGYYFATDFEGVEILFADHPEYEGKNILDLQDAKGAYVIRDMIDLTKREQEGFYKYYWSKPNSPGRDFPKIAFIKRFAPFNCFIGTGEYIDDVERDIQEEVLERIGKIRFGQNGYIFVVSYDGTTLMNSVQPELIGKNIWEMTDPHGVKVIQQERRAVEKPEGDFIYYEWEKPTTGKITPKVTFMKGFPQWGWMIGGGAYTDEIESEILTREVEIKDNARNYLNTLGIFLIIILLVILVFSYVISFYFKQALNIFLSFFKKMETGGEPIDTEKLFLHEFMVLGQSANLMLLKRQQAEYDLQQSKTNLEIIFKIVPTGVGVIINGKIERVNNRLSEMTGFPQEELINNSPRIFYATLGDFEYVYQEILSQIIKYKTSTIETRWQHKQGAIIDVLLNSSPVDKNSISSGIVFSVLDITDSKRSKTLLEESEQRFRLAFKTSPDAIAIHRLVDLICVDINDGFTNITGFARDEIIGKASLDVNLFPNPEELSRLRQGLWEKGYIKNLEAQVQRKDGSIISGLLSANIISLKGVRHIISITRDISELKKSEEDKLKLEKQLRQAQKMEAIGTLAGGIAHDFNNILAAIIGHAELALLPSPADSKQRKNLEHILKASQRAKELVQQILGFSRQGETNLRIIDLAPIIDEAMKLLRSSLPTTIEIHSKIEPK